MTTSVDTFVHRFERAASPGAPTLLLLHGTGGDESDLLALGREVGGGAALLSPRGRVLERGMPRFFRRFAEGVFDEADVQLRAHELAQFVRVAAAQYGVDAGRIFALGFSNGANIAAALMLLEPTLLRGAVLLRAQPVITPAQQPDLSGRAALVAAGSRDPIVPASESERLALVLRSSGADVELTWTNAGHNLDPSDVRAAATWLEQRMRAGARS